MVPDRDAYRPSHHLLADDYTGALGTLLAVTLERADEAYVALDEAELEADLPDADECADTWTAVRGEFEHLSGAPLWGSSRTEYRLTGEEAALERLCGLVGGVCGAHFVFQVLLAVEGEAVLEAVPHHGAASVSALPLGGETYLDAVAAAFDGQAACLVADGTRVEWDADGTHWAIRGGSLCKESPDGRNSTCWGISNLLAARVHRSEPTLELTWDTGDPDGPVERALFGVTRALASRPERVPCPDRVTAERAKTVLAEVLARYDGRSL